MNRKAFEPSENDLLRSKRLREVREAEGLNQSDFAKLIHSGQSQLSSMETGKRKVSQSTASAVIEAFPKYNLAWLLGFSNDQTEDDVEWTLRRVHSTEMLKVQDGLESLAFAAGYEVKYSLDADCWVITNGFSKESVTLDYDHLLSIAYEVADFARFRLQGLFESDFWLERPKH